MLLTHHAGNPPVSVDGLHGDQVPVPALRGGAEDALPGKVWAPFLRKLLQRAHQVCGISVTRLPCASRR